MSATPLSCRESVSCGLGDFSFLCAITGFISILAVSLPVSMKDYWLVLDHCVSSLLKQCFWHGTWPSTQIYSAGGGVQFQSSSLYLRENSAIWSCKNEITMLCFILSISVVFKLFGPLHPCIFQKNIVLKGRESLQVIQWGWNQQHLLMSNLLKP